jgi:hypothetical protein
MSADHGVSVCQRMLPSSLQEARCVDRAVGTDRGLVRQRVHRSAREERVAVERECPQRIPIDIKAVDRPPGASTTEPDLSPGHAPGTDGGVTGPGELTGRDVERKGAGDDLEDAVDHAVGPDGRRALDVLAAECPVDDPLQSAIGREGVDEPVGLVVGVDVDGAVGRDCRSPPLVVPVGLEGPADAPVGLARSHGQDDLIALVTADLDRDRREAQRRRLGHVRHDACVGPRGRPGAEPPDEDLARRAEARPFDRHASAAW